MIRISNPQELNVCLEMLALSMGTTIGRFNSASEIPDHHLEYLMKKLTGKDSLCLDSNNERLYKRLKIILESLM
jgi:hypothetical protein